MLVNDLGADRPVDGHRNAQLGTGEQHRDVATWYVVSRAEVFRERLTRTLLRLRPARDRRVHLPTGLLRHAERSVTQAGGHVFAGTAVRGELEVVNGGAAVHRDDRDRASPRQRKQERAQTDLAHVAAEPGGYAAHPFRGGGR